MGFCARQLDPGLSHKLFAQDFSSRVHISPLHIDGCMTLGLPLARACRRCRKGLLLGLFDTQFLLCSCVLTIVDVSVCATYLQPVTANLLVVDVEPQANVLRGLQGAETTQDLNTAEERCGSTFTASHDTARKLKNGGSPVVLAAVCAVGLFGVLNYFFLSLLNKFCFAFRSITRRF